ncbi:MAG: AraC family transcriptional regulator [Oscillospiraceae bacterium]
MAKKVSTFDARQNMILHSFEIFRYRDSYLNDVALHHHDFYEFYLFLSGDVNYTIESRNYSLQQGDLLMISPMELHRPIITPAKLPYERIVLWVDAAFLNQFSTEQTDLAQCFNTRRSEHTNLLRPDSNARVHITQLMDAMIEESANAKYGGDLGAVAHLLELLVFVNRLTMRAGVQHHELEDKSAPVITSVLNYINTHYREDLSLDELAARFFISKYHLSHEFNRLVGTSVYRYIIQKRLIIAKQLLSDGLPPTSAYIQCGFGDYANFYRAFKSEYSISPKEFLSRMEQDVLLNGN